MQYAWVSGGVSVKANPPPDDAPPIQLGSPIVVDPDREFPFRDLGQIGLLTVQAFIGSDIPQDTSGGPVL
jgi:hypothetical protein